MLEATPVVRQVARADRGFLASAVRHLAADLRIRQFLDIGTGLPIANNTHEVAQQAASESRVVYVDNDRYGHLLLEVDKQSVAGRRVDELSERALAYFRRDEIGFVFQAFQLMDELTAQENVLSLLGDLHAKGLTLVIVTHDERIAATADRLISKRDGSLVDETRLTGGSRGNLGTFAEWEQLG